MAIPKLPSYTQNIVIPAQAGIHADGGMVSHPCMDPHLRGDDNHKGSGITNKTLQRGQKRRRGETSVKGPWLAQLSHVLSHQPPSHLA